MSVLSRIVKKKEPRTSHFAGAESLTRRLGEVPTTKGITTGRKHTTPILDRLWGGVGTYVGDPRQAGDER